MHIAFISYEFPPETSFGGIGTYTFQLSVALAASGHDVEVFSCSRKTNSKNERVQPRLLLHRAVADKRKTFSEAIVPIFTERQNIYPFDIIESPEYGSEGAGIKRSFPDIPFTVKLHTPFFLHDRYNKNAKKMSLPEKGKAYIKKLLNHTNYRKEDDADYIFTSKADSISSPSLFLANMLQKKWQLSYIKLLPNYYIADDSLLQLPIKPYAKKVVAFIGRLEKRKGISTIVQAIPDIINQHPGVIIRFIGTSGTAPDGITPMDKYIIQVLKKYSANLHFVGHVPANKLADALAEVSVIMIPSLFDNFPYVGLESMAAGKAVVVSSNGGIKEMFPSGENKGCMVINPAKPKQLSKSVVQLLNNPDVCTQMGINNRKHVVSQFAGDRLLNEVITFYSETITMASKKIKAGKS